MRATLAPNCYFVSPSEHYGAPVPARCSFSASLGCSWAAHGCSWLLLTAAGCSWLSLADVNVNSRSKENNLFGVSRLGHVLIVFANTNALYSSESGGEGVEPLAACFRTHIVSNADLGILTHAWVEAVQPHLIQDGTLRLEILDIMEKAAVASRNNTLDLVVAGGFAHHHKHPYLVGMCSLVMCVH
jgi:hypothetical protein